MRSIRNISIPREDRHALLQRIIDKVVIDEISGCWLWFGWNDGGGYGKISYKGKPIYTHRAAYIGLHGEIPDGHVLDHLRDRCCYRNCCNPDHLEPVTCRENLYRGDWVHHRYGRKDE